MFTVLKGSKFICVSTDCLDFHFKVFGLQCTSLAHAKGLFKIIFGHYYFIIEQFFLIYTALFTTFGLQKYDMSYFSCGASEK